MGQERVTDLGVTSTEKPVENSLDLDLVVDTSAGLPIPSQSTPGGIHEKPCGAYLTRGKIMCF